VHGATPHQPEFLQAVTEVMESLWPFIEKTPATPSKACWSAWSSPSAWSCSACPGTDDHGTVQVNRGYRIQHSMAIGPYKGGLRFHPSVNLSVLKFLAFEQTFKNALTTLPMGGGKGGSDFDPKGKSPGEVMRFCQAFVSELFRHMWAPTPTCPQATSAWAAAKWASWPACTRSSANRADCVFTGKGLSFGGSLIRPEATGYGTVYFARKCSRPAASPSTACACRCPARATWRSTPSKRPWNWAPRSSPCPTPAAPCRRRRLHPEKLAILMDVKNHHYGRVSDYAASAPVGEVSKPACAPGTCRWTSPCPAPRRTSWTRTTPHAHQERRAVRGRRRQHAFTIEAAKAFEAAGVLYAPGKASNAGGVATSGLEMSQNAMRLLDPRRSGRPPAEIMQGIHAACLKHGSAPMAAVSYIDGANIAGFVKVADAMLAQGHKGAHGSCQRRIVHGFEVLGIDPAQLGLVKLRGTFAQMV
jgi:glutamate dehydrogenase (NADP+)